MSGIIGSIGSKSGIIGETELDYEEGTWTPKQDSSGTAFGGWGNGSYIKIGSNVNVWFDVQNYDSNDPKIYNLPFTKDSVNPAGSCDINYQENVDNDVMGRINNDTSIITLNVGNSSPTVGSSSRMIGHATYRV